MGCTGNSIIDNVNVAAELKKAIIHWSTYKLPVHHTLSDDEAESLRKIPQWPQLPQREKEEVHKVLFDVYNAEQSKWNMRTKQTTGAMDTRSYKRRD